MLKKSCFNDYTIGGGGVHYFSLEARMSSFYRLLEKGKGERNTKAWRKGLALETRGKGEAAAGDVKHPQWCLGTTHDPSATWL